MNQQEPEKQSLDPHLLEVHSMFYTLQGEGPFSGKPAIFIRLAGCNLQCPGCDTEYTAKREQLTANSICEKLKQFEGAFKPLIVITGGEPFRQNIGPLVRRLVSYGYPVQIETNGTLYVQDLPWDSITIVCSPKTGSINKKLQPHIDAYKYVVNRLDINIDDGLPSHTLGQTCSVARPPADWPKEKIYLSPMDYGDDERSKVMNKQNTDVCIASCLRFGYTCTHQMHKIWGLE